MKETIKNSFILLLATLLPATATAYNIFVDGIFYNIIGSEATVTQRILGSDPDIPYYRYYSGNVTIPSTIIFNGTSYTVTAIGDGAFHYCTELTSVTIPNSVNYIGENAFAACTGLTSVTIGNSVTYIGSEAFWGCCGLTSITIPNSVNYIGDYAFSGTPWYNNQPDGLVYAGLVAYEYKGTMPDQTDITLKDGTLGIAGGAFNGCSGLTDITIPNSVNYIGENAFNNTAWFNNQPDGLVYAGLVAYKYKGTMPDSSSITLRVGTLGIAGGAFSGCGGLTSINLPNSVSIISDFAFARCSSLSRIDIPNSVNHIGFRAFQECPNLSSVTIPNSVRIISDYAFYNCTGLKSITIGNSVSYIGEEAFQACSSVTDLTWNARNCSSKGYMDTRNIERVTIGDEVESLPDDFVKGSKIATVTIPNSVTSIGSGAFQSCNNLSSVTIPNAVNYIGDYAFSGTPWYNNQPDGLVYLGSVLLGYTGVMPAGTSITIKDGTTTICGGAFSYRSQLASVNIPNSVSYIGREAFVECSGLTNINIPNSLNYIDSDVFWGCSGLTSINIPNSVNYIGDYAFEACAELTNVNIPNSVIYIGYNAFADTRLTSVNIPNSVKYIYNSTFQNSELTNITVANDNPYYDSRDNCNAIIETASNTLIEGCMNTIIPNSVTAIGNDAFYGCTGLTSVTIPSSVTSIGSFAFRYCSGLTSVTCLAATPPTLQSISVFDNSTYINATLNVFQPYMSFYRTANYWKNFSNIQVIADVFEKDGIYYHILTDNTVKVTSNPTEENYYRGDVVIPGYVTYFDIPFNVTSIDANAFDGCDELTSVVIGDAVETIGEEAFQGCTGLTSVTFGNGVTSIGERAFNYCNALQTVTCRGTVPPAMASSNCFSSAAYRKATLKVHRNYIDSYTATDYWYKFENIEGFGSAGPGDVNGDGITNIADITALIDRLLNSDADDEFYFESADFNFNGRLDIGDVTTLIDTMLTGSN